MQSDMFLITPMTQKIALEPGQVYDGSVRVANPADSTRDFTFTSGVSPYTVIDDEYTASLSERNNRTMIADWITIEDPSGTLEPNETKDIHFTITVPENAPSGAQYAAIVISQDETTKEQSGIKVDNVFEIASIIYAEVAGETIRDGNIIENTLPSFTTTLPITATAKLDNHGNVHNEATIIISAKNNLTGEVYLPTDTNEGRYSELILPDTTKNISRDIEDLPGLGIVHVEQTIYYNGFVSTESRDIVICPIWFMALIALTILLFIAIIVRLIIRHRRKPSLDF